MTTKSLFPPLLAAMLLALLLGGCSAYRDLHPGAVQEVAPPALLESQSVEVPPLPAIAPAGDYLVGAGDILFVNVDGRPELGSPVLSGSKLSGSRVDGQGRIRLPLVGSVAVAGLTLDQIQQRLSEAFSVYLKQPWVVVEVAEYRSQPINLLGQFKNPGTYYLDRPLTLIQGVALGGGLMDSANLRAARLLRGEQTQPVDIYQLLTSGSPGQNAWLQAGDTIYVPDDRNQNVFVFGAVKKPGPVPMPNGRLLLDAALASSGLDEIGGDQRYVRIIRSLSATKGQLLVVDLSRSLRGEALPFKLEEGDIIYVPRSGIGNWNQALNEMLPSLQAISAVLQPFVQIKFLQED
jgi:polysaccharide export outer membrane protein